MRWIVALLCCSHLAKADVALDATDDPATVLAPWKTCEALKDKLRFPPDDGDPKLTAKARPDGADVFLTSEGNGRWGIGSYMQMRLQRGRCDAWGAEIYGPKEWVDGQLRTVGWGRKPPTLTEAVALLGSTLVTRVDAPELAAARMVVSSLGPMRAPQPFHPGRPRSSAPTVWPPTALDKLGVSLSELDGDLEWERAKALVVEAVRAPRLLVKNAAYEVWELRFRARNGGGLLAIYDIAHDRHRWVWGTHGDYQWDGKGALDDAHFRIMAFDDAGLVVWISFEDDNSLVSVDFVKGTAREVDVGRHVACRPLAKGVAIFTEADEDSDDKGHLVRVIPLTKLR